MQLGLGRLMRPTAFGISKKGERGTWLVAEAGAEEHSQLWGGTQCLLPRFSHLPESFLFLLHGSSLLTPISVQISGGSESSRYISLV